MSRPLRFNLILALVVAACSSAAPGLGGAPSPAVGKQLFVAKGCIACHVVQQIEEARGTVGPSLDGMGDPERRRTVGGGALDNTPENLKRWLKDPPAVKPGTTMPDLSLSAQEIEHLAAFLLTLKE